MTSTVRFTDDPLDQQIQNIRGRTVTSYGKYKHEINTILSIKTVLEAADMSLSSGFRKVYPEIATEIFRGRGHIAEVLDWYGGRLPLSIGYLNPIVSGLVEAYTLESMGGEGRRYRSGRTANAFSATSLGVSAGLQETIGYQKLMLW